MSSSVTSVRVQQRTTTTTTGSLPFGLSLGKITLATLLLKIIPTAFNLISYATLHGVRIEYVSWAFGYYTIGATHIYASRVENLSRASDLLVQLCLGFWIVTFAMVVTSFSLKPNLTLRLPNTTCFDIAYHLLAGLLLGGTSVAVIQLSNFNIPSKDKSRFVAGGSFALMAAILHVLHFVLSLITWLKTH